MNRKVDTIISGQKTTDGDGVSLTRILSRPNVKQFDPYLMLDSFGSDDPGEGAGFPWHPHRGIITISYLLKGGIEHEDSLGNHGLISSGGVQWMCAASGIIHQEMPKAGPDGNRGFQFWLNLPASQKMNKPDYGDIKSDEIPVVLLNDISVKVIAGTFNDVTGPLHFDTTEPEMYHITLGAKSSFEIDTARDKNFFAIPLTPGVSVDNTSLPAGGAILFTKGESIRFDSGESKAEIVLVGGNPLNEPIAWEGPIVMNSRDELITAFEEYRNGTFVK